MEPQKKPIHLNENDTPYLYEPFRNQMPAKRPHPAEKEKILKPWQGLLVFAFLISPMGLPTVAAWLLGKVQSLRYAIQDRIYR